MLDPLNEYLDRPSKQVRAQLVSIGFDLASGSAVRDKEHEDLLSSLGAMVETIHAGSLIIDDIQDSSMTRRGGPALHALIGMPSAINAGNWLYYRATDLIRSQKIPAEIELELYRVHHHAMIQAHYGQSLDLAHDMTFLPQAKITPISMATLGLKTGALMRMCAEFGAVAASAHSDLRRTIADFGQSFGVLLQMFNDLAEFRESGKSDTPRGPFIRPSWVWAVAATTLEPHEFTKFQALMSRTIQKGEDDPRTTHPVIAVALAQACEAMDSCLRGLKDRFAGNPALNPIEEMARKVMNSHG